MYIKNKNRITVLGIMQAFTGLVLSIYLQNIIYLFAGVISGILFVAIMYLFCDILAVLEQINTELKKK